MPEVDDPGVMAETSDVGRATDAGDADELALAVPRSGRTVSRRSAPGSPDPEAASGAGFALRGRLPAFAKALMLALASALALRSATITCKGKSKSAMQNGD